MKQFTTIVNRNCVDLNDINLNANQAWVTFMHNNWEQHWFAVRDDDGNHLDWDSDLIMDICRTRFGMVCMQFGIANTEQMLMGNAMRDNL
jgi:hypothetical protein